MNQYGFAEFLRPVWTFCSIFTIQAVFRTERLDAICFLSLVSLIVLFVWRRIMNMFSSFFVKKRVLYTGIFKVWCLGNNLREKYAFTFIQHSRSMYWLISTHAYNPEASKFPLLLGRFQGNDPSYKMGRVCFSSGTNRPLAPLTRAQDIRVCCVKWVNVPNHSTEHVAAWDMVSKGISIRFTIKDGEQTVQFRQRLTINSSAWTLIIKKPSRSVSSQRNLNRVFLNSDQLKGLFEDTRNSHRLLALL